MSASMFNHAAQLVFHGGQFNNILESSPDNKGFDLLRQNVATGAFYDAAERGDPPKCHPQTRLAILAEIQQWVRHPEVFKKFIVWLYGPAGSGKSAIAQTIAEILAKERILVASFFFSRTGAGRNDTTRFIPSIAYQLSLSIPEVQPRIATAVAQDPLIFSRTLISQIQALIIQPLNDVATILNAAQPRLVIVDGLDEASKPTTQKELLEALAVAIQQLRVPLVFLVASRPETVIRQTFNKQPLQSLMQSLALDEDYKPDKDIRLFLSAKFNDIRKSHPSGNVLSVDWPSEGDMDYLVRKASGQFIYASTVMKYIDSPQDNPKKQLRVILALSGPGKDTPFAQLDALYYHILSSVKYISRVLEILALQYLHPPYDKNLSIDYIEAFLGYDAGDVAAALTDMHALIHVPPSNGDSENNNLRVYHASLQDFLMDKSRSGCFFLDAEIRHVELSRRILRYITTTRKNNPEYLELFGVSLACFIHHYSKSSHTTELVADLQNFSLMTCLVNISPQIFYGTSWDDFFNHLRSECDQTNIDLYRRLRDEFDTWIRSQYEQYPKFVQDLISTAFSIAHIVPYFLTYIAGIFDILAHSLAPSEAIRLRKLDRELFHFQSGRITGWALDNADRDHVHRYFTDHSRSGVHFADRGKLCKLAGEIAKVVCQRGSDYFPAVIEDHLYDDLDRYDLIWYSEFVPYLEVFSWILEASPENHELAQLLWELAVQYKENDPIRRRKKIMADACLDYIKRCGISIPEHVHQADCMICVNFKPIFPTTSFEAEEGPTDYSISINEPDESPSQHLTNTPQYTLSNSLSNASFAASSVSSSRSPNIGHSLNIGRSPYIGRSLNIGRSPTTMPNRPTNALLSTVRPLSNPSSKSSSLSLAKRCARIGGRPASAGPSIPCRPSPSSLSATSHTQTPNPAASSSADHLLLESHSASASMSSVSQPMRKSGKPSRKNVVVGEEVLTRQPSEKSIHKKPRWR